MRDFCKVSPTIWRSQKFSRLDKSDQLLYFYFLTCTHGNSIGCFYLPVSYAAIDLKIDENTLREGIERVSEAGLVSYDEQEQVVLIYNWLTFNEPMNPKHGQKIASDISKIPSPEFQREVARSFNAVSRAKGWSVTAPIQKAGKGIERVSTQDGDKTETKTETETPKSKKDRKAFEADNLSGMADWFKQHTPGVDPQATRRKLLNWCDAKGKTYKDYFAALRTWAEKEQADLNARTGSQSGTKTSTLPRKQYDPATSQPWRHE